VTLRRHALELTRKGATTGIANLPDDWLGAQQVTDSRAWIAAGCPV
jgi:hypothetical protein